MKMNKRPITEEMVEAAAISLFSTDYEAGWLCGWHEISEEHSHQEYRLRAKAALVAARTAEVRE